MQIPEDLLPADGRFGCGPSKVRPEQLEHLAAHGVGIMGTSHRQAPVKAVVARVRSGLADLFGLPAGYEVALGNGGTTAFWDAAALGLVRERVAPSGLRGVLVEVRLGRAAARPSWTSRSSWCAEPGDAPAPRGGEAVDIVAWAHNETSTGVMVAGRAAAPRDAVHSCSSTPPRAPAGCRSPSPSRTSTTSRRRSRFAADGGLWLALLSPAALERIERDQGVGPLGCQSSSPSPIALENSRKDQTYNTPAARDAAPAAPTSSMDARQTAASTGASSHDARVLLDPLRVGGALAQYATPFVADPAKRWLAGGDGRLRADKVDTTAIARALRANGVIDVEHYRKGWAQPAARGVVPAAQAEDVHALCACIDWVLERL